MNVPGTLSGGVAGLRAFSRSWPVARPVRKVVDSDIGSIVARPAVGGGCRGVAATLRDRFALAGAKGFASVGRRRGYPTGHENRRRSWSRAMALPTLKAMSRNT